MKTRVGRAKAIEELKDALTALNESGWDDGERYGLSPTSDALGVIHKLVLGSIDALPILEELNELSETIDGIRNSLDDTDNLALGLVSGKYSEKDFLENYDGIVKEVERLQEMLED